MERATGNVGETAGPVKMPGDDNKDRLGVENNTKIIRILTVIAYVCSVSMAAVMLSLYYVFIWDPSPSGQSAVTPAALIQTQPPNNTESPDSSPILVAIRATVQGNTHISFPSSPSSLSG